ncbi:MAG: nuclear transport factor 2 family protein [Candidatus Zixiibacteriota bacterium]|nr:MAG: nuclear transport factor 2 family protein [candidate division Zixibacteria bacterium]
MSKIDLKDLSLAIQNAYEGKKIDEVLVFYHPDIVMIGPSMRVPVKGIDELKTVLEAQFKNPQRSVVKLSDFSIGEVGEDVFSVLCRIEGRQLIYYSSYGFRGWLSRVFVISENIPKVIFEHLTLEK